MSGTKYSKCPKCNFKYLKELARLENRIVEDYGKIDPVEYLQIIETRNSFKEPDFSLSEDYEMWIDKDGFHCYYGARCNICGFEFSFNDRKRIKFED